MSILPKLILIFTIKIILTFGGIDKLTLKFIYNANNNNSQNNFEKNKVGVLTLPEFKIYNNTIAIKAV